MYCNIHTRLSLGCFKRKYQRVGGLDNKHLFLMILEAGKYKIRVLADQVSGNSSPPDL